MTVSGYAGEMPRTPEPGEPGFQPCIRCGRHAYQFGDCPEVPRPESAPQGRGGSACLTYTEANILVQRAKPKKKAKKGGNE